MIGEMTRLSSLSDPGVIPKRIIHIYSAPPGRPPDLPLSSQAALVNARLLHPDFELRLFGAAEMKAFLDEEFPEYNKVMDGFAHPIQRFDFFRYLAIYRLGGFYFDLDIYLARSIEPLLPTGCVFPFEELTLSDHLREKYDMDWEIANYGFGAAPGHPFIKAIIENCVRAQRDPAWADEMMRGIPRRFRGPFAVPVTTGPGMVTRTLAENPDLQDQVTVLFPDDVCDDRTWQRFGDFGVHLMQGSWRKRDGFILSRLRRIWEVRRRKQLMKKSLVRGPRRVGRWKQYAGGRLPVPTAV